MTQIKIPSGQPAYIDEQGRKFYPLADFSTGALSINYLSTLAAKGKLKAFKMGQAWVTSAQWLEECQERIKHSLHQEIDQAQRSNQLKSHHGRWVKARPKKKNIEVDLQITSSSAILVAALGALIGVIAIVGTYGDLISPNLWQRGDDLFANRGVVADDFLLATSQFYNWPVATGRRVYEEKISDEALTIGWQRLWRRLAGNPAGDVAGENETLTP